jgi:hypothetical protein
MPSLKWILTVPDLGDWAVCDVGYQPIVERNPMDRSPLLVTTGGGRSSDSGASLERTQTRGHVRKGKYTDISFCQRLAFVLAAQLIRELTELENTELDRTTPWVMKTKKRKLCGAGFACLR